MPIAESFYYLTPYQYASNDPILNIDLDGLEGTSVNQVLKQCPSCGINPSESVKPILYSRPAGLKSSGKVSEPRPEITFTITKGKQASLKVGPVGFKADGGSKEIQKYTDVTGLKNVADKNSTHKEFSMNIAVVNIGREITEKKSTVKDPVFNNDVEKTTSEVTTTASIGAKGLELGVERKVTVDQYGPFGDQNIASDSGTQPVVGYSQDSEASGKKNGVSFSFGAYYNVEIKIDFIQIFKNLTIRF